MLLALQHTDRNGEWQASTLGVAYDWTTGKLDSHKYLWQKASTPVEAPADDLQQVLVKAVTPPARARWG
jgi:hypothetical protein